MSRIKTLFASFRIWILIVSVLISLIAINPALDAQGVAIRSIIPNSLAAEAGIQSPVAGTLPRNLEIITSLNGQEVQSLADYYAVIDNVIPGDLITVETTKSSYSITVPLENTAAPLSNETNQTNISQPRIGISVSSTPESNIRKGLDLQGGTRVLIEPVDDLTEENYTLLRNNLEQRLNVFGLSDVRVSVVRDAPLALGGEAKYILLEIAGATIEEVENLVSSQGVFEAKIGNTTVFRGEKRDIRFVAHAAPQAGLGPSACQQSSQGWVCPYFFGITLSAEAAQLVADTTDELSVINDPNSGTAYLNQSIDFFLDGVLTNSLSIAADLKGRATTQIQITGSGTGATEYDAAQAALKDMKQMQTIIETGSLPTDITITKADEISPLLGSEFLSNAIVVVLLALVGVFIVVFIRFRKIIVSLPMTLTALSEIVIVLGVASLIGWQLDLPAFAGLVIIIGTSVDHQIVITDELLNRGLKTENSRRRLKKAFFIIMAAYLTTMVAMIPLMFAGAGLLKNFALTTMIGLTVGVLITRPAYAKVLQIFTKNEE